MAKTEHNSKAVPRKLPQGYMHESAELSENSSSVLFCIYSFLSNRTNEGSKASVMLGFLFNERECRELDYVLRKELDEMLFDLNDKRIDADIKGAIESRYKVIFRMYARVASPKEISRYARNRTIR
jgi:hypothetical protein